MQPTKIRLMRHHIISLVFAMSMTEIGLLNRKVNGILYGPGDLEYRTKILQSLDPDGTIVEVVDDKQPDGRRNIDFLCHIKDCPYISNCGSGKGLKMAIFKRAWYLFPLILILGRGNGEISKMLEPIFPTGEYRLKDLIDTAMPYFDF